ncbi:HPr family phosphocarrier protein [Fictibacillus fluitans]|uniref:HPr family phosphocarrier protein n=1 Tax=Fictibacillus fluitans TaxID=3058422 RepID=A0ABT8HUD2_9BACL|nr:HPr family phosphocarrier protein [Fictibacillus sp. NE201]MDN4524380.1 HPr family phosphocarrier protein [Fictibacillus sp. NE201]
MKTYCFLQDKMNSRTISKLVHKANEFEECQIYFEFDNCQMNAKSMLSMSKLSGIAGLCCITALGQDQQDALEGLRLICAGKVVN